MKNTSYAKKSVIGNKNIELWVRAHPVASFFILAYTISWILWAPAALGYLGDTANVLVYIGVFGPAAAAMLVTWIFGDSVKFWFKGLFHWRVSPIWYAYALGLPALLIIIVTLEFLILGQKIELYLLKDRLIAYFPTLIFLSLLGGGNEEPGWRGFALPNLLKNRDPIPTTLILGVLWALWHIPLLAAMTEISHGLGGVLLIIVLIATLLGIVAYAFTYTYLYNRTKSVLLCILLHGSFNTANGLLILRSETVGVTYAILQISMTLTLWIIVGIIIIYTKGSLGIEVEAIKD